MILAYRLVFPNKAFEDVFESTVQTQMKNYMLTPSQNNNSVLHTDSSPLYQCSINM